LQPEVDIFSKCPACSFAFLTVLEVNLLLPMTPLFTELINRKDTALQRIVSSIADKAKE
jgi:hypothetical protein